MDELRQQCRFAHVAYQSLKTSLNALDSERVFYHVHAFLGHAGVVARLLWPAREASMDRGTRLRTELKVGEGSVLQLRGMRPQLEAEDERFEDWLQGLESANYVDMNVMPVAAISDIKPDSFHRSLDPDTFMFHWRGVACELKPVSEELKALDFGIQSWQKTHHPW
jgi:hypothetical protein